MWERERGEDSVSRRHIILLPNGPAFSSAVWSLISSMPSLKIEVVCMLGCREAQARVVAIEPWMGMNCVLEGGGVCVCVRY